MVNIAISEITEEKRKQIEIYDDLRVKYVQYIGEEHMQVIEKDPVPDVRDDTEGRVASVSLEVNETGLANEVAVFPFASRAVTVTLNDVPAVVEVGTEERLNRVAAPGFTVTEAVFETAEPRIVAPRLTNPERVPVKFAV
jgi:hypothetical protein